MFWMVSSITTSEVEIEEHYVDTSGYTDHLFALCHLLGFRFPPRIRDLADHRLFCFEAPARYEGLVPLIGGKIHSRTICDNWGDIAPLIASLKQGTASASLLVSKLAGHPRQNHLAVALREIGRIERSLLTLAWLQDPELRRRVTAGLNKGEAHHTLKRAIRFYKRGSVSDHTQLEQDLNAMTLNLVVAAITLWNTAYLDRAITVLEKRGTPVPAEYLPHISPLAGSTSLSQARITGKAPSRPGRQVQTPAPAGDSSRRRTDRLAYSFCQSVQSGHMRRVGRTHLGGIRWAL